MIQSSPVNGIRVALEEEENNRRTATRRYVQEIGGDIELIRNDDDDVLVLFWIFSISMSDVDVYDDVCVWISSSQRPIPIPMSCLYSVIDCKNTIRHLFYNNPTTYCRFRLLFSCFFDFELVSDSFFVPGCLSRLISSINNKQKQMVVLRESQSNARRALTSSELLKRCIVVAGR